MPEKPKIVVVGSSNTDMVMRCRVIPRAGETVLGGDFSMIPGGKGANQAVAAARLGAEVAFIARVGSDLLGRQAIEGYVADGINVTHVTSDPAVSTGVAAIWVDEASGENRIVVASGANASLTPADIYSARSVIAAAAVLVCQLETPIETVIAALRTARAHSVVTILNPAPTIELPDEIFSLVDVLVPNEIEAGALCADMNSDPQGAAEKLISSGIKTVVVTLGPAGAVYVTAGERGHIPAPGVDNVVDTTAAGDCFTGAFAVRTAEGASIVDAVKFAVAAASISVTRAGAQSSLPTRGMVEAHLPAKRGPLAPATGG